MMQVASNSSSRHPENKTSNLKIQMQTNGQAYEQASEKASKKTSKKMRKHSKASKQARKANIAEKGDEWVDEQEAKFLTTRLKAVPERLHAPCAFSLNPLVQFALQPPEPRSQPLVQFELKPLDSHLSPWCKSH